MWTQILSIVATAVLSSVLTLALAAWIYSRHLRPRLERDLQDKLRGTLATATEGLGEVIRDRVRRGVLDAVAELPAPNLIREARRTVLRTATELVEGGLASLLVDRERQEDEDR